MNTPGVNGGSGGDVQINGGVAYGMHAANTGGDVALTGGTSQAATGGSVYLTTGLGTTKSSGMIILSTSNGGTSGGVSGMIQLITGTHPNLPFKTSFSAFIAFAS